MLTDHAITAVNSAKHITWQLCLFNLRLLFLILSLSLSLLWLRLRLLLTLFIIFQFLLCLLLASSFLCINHFSDRVEGPGAIVTDEHSCAATIAFTEHLSAAATSASAVKLADLVVAQIATASILAGCLHYLISLGVLRMATAISWHVILLSQNQIRESDLSRDV